MDSRILCVRMMKLADMFVSASSLWRKLQLLPELTGIEIEIAETLPHQTNEDAFAFRDAITTLNGVIADTARDIHRDPPNDRRLLASGSSIEERFDALSGHVKALLIKRLRDHSKDVARSYLVAVVPTGPISSIRDARTELALTGMYARQLFAFPGRFVDEPESTLLGFIRAEERVARFFSSHDITDEGRGQLGLLSVFLGLGSQIRSQEELVARVPRVTELSLPGGLYQRRLSLVSALSEARRAHLDVGRADSADLCHDCSSTGVEAGLEKARQQLTALSAFLSEGEPASWELDREAHYSDPGSNSIRSIVELTRDAPHAKVLNQYFFPTLGMRLDAGHILAGLSDMGIMYSSDDHLTIRDIGFLAPLEILWRLGLPGERDSYSNRVVALRKLVAGGTASDSAFLRAAAIPPTEEVMKAVLDAIRPVAIAGSMAGLGVLTEVLGALLECKSIDIPKAVELGVLGAIAGIIAESLQKRIRPGNPE